MYIVASCCPYDFWLLCVDLPIFGIGFPDAADGPNGCHRATKPGLSSGPPHARSVPLSGLNSPFAIGLATKMPARSIKQMALTALLFYLIWLVGGFIRKYVYTNVIKYVCLWA